MSVQIPIGYQLTSDHGDESGVLYGFTAPNFRTNERWTWKLGAIDAMWTHVRAAATKAAIPGTAEKERMRSNSCYAMGYIEGKQFVDAEVAIELARAGYTFRDKTAAECVKILLVMLNGA